MNANFESHNLEIRQLWSEFRAGRAPRVPVTVGLSSRFAILDRNLNPNRYTFQQYHENPEAMMEIQYALEKFRRYEIDDDTEKGFPAEGIQLSVDFQNVYEAAWFGAEIIFPENNVPTTKRLLHEHNKYDFIRQPFPDPFGGVMADCKRYYDFFTKQKEKSPFSDTLVGDVTACSLWTDGPFTVACNLLGMEACCLECYDDPEYFAALMMYITDATIHRISAWRAALGMPAKQPGWGFADDAVQLLSLGVVREMLLPCYLKLRSALSVEGIPIGIHLCGDATRHMLLLKDPLNVDWFDTGFPVPFASFAKALGPDVTWQGGPNVSLLMLGSVGEIERETARILGEVMPHTRRFVLRDGNDIAPSTPLCNMQAMVDEGRRYGVVPKKV